MTIICAVFSLLIALEIVFICSKTFNLKNEKVKKSLESAILEQRSARGLLNLFYFRFLGSRVTKTNLV